jgi:hypothetical protein
MEPNPNKYLNLKVRLVSDPKFPKQIPSWTQMEVWDQTTGAMLPVSDVQVVLNAKGGLPQVVITCIPEIEIKTIGIAEFSGKAEPEPTPTSQLRSEGTFADFYKALRAANHVPDPSTTLAPTKVTEITGARVAGIDLSHSDKSFTRGDKPFTRGVPEEQSTWTRLPQSAWAARLSNQAQSDLDAKVSLLQEKEQSSPPAEPKKKDPYDIFND